MRAMPESYVRKGVVLSLQFDFDAVELLRQLSPTRKSYGRYLSELVRRDHIRRQDWERMRAGQQEALVAMEHYEGEAHG